MTRRPVVAMLLAIVTAACGSGPTELAGSVREPLPVVGTASLPEVSAGGAPFAMRAADQGLLIVYFGYTSCPDVCPTTMAEVGATLEELADDAARIEVAMATVDPERDRDQILTTYLRFFVEEGHALRTEDDADLRAVTDLFGATYEVSVGDDGMVEVAHTGHLYVVDDEGRLRVTWPFGTPSSDMAADLRILLEDR